MPRQNGYVALEGKLINQYVVIIGVSDNDKIVVSNDKNQCDTIPFKSLKIICSYKYYDDQKGLSNDLVSKIRRSRSRCQVKN